MAKTRKKGLEEKAEKASKPKPGKKANIDVSGVKGRFEKMAAIVDGAISQYGTSMLHSADAKKMTVVPRVSTGLYRLDVATGGGLPFGRITLTYGPKSGGKTTLYLMALANAQRLCANCMQPGTFEYGELTLPDTEKGGTRTVETQVIVDCPCGKPRDMICLWCDSENAWYGPWVKQRGIWPEKVILMKPEYGEAAYDIVRAFISSNVIDIVVVDSIAHMTPEAERTTSMRQQHQGVSARMNNRFFRELTNIMAANVNHGGMTTMWLINQIREKIGVLFGSPDTLTGGKGQGFIASAEIEMRPGQIHVSKDTEEPLFREHSWTLKKSKISPPGMKGSYKMALCDMGVIDVGDIMEHEEVIDAAVEMGIIDQISERKYKWGDDEYSKKDLVEYLATNKDEFAELKAVLIKSKIGTDDTLDDSGEE